MLFSCEATDGMLLFLVFSSVASARNYAFVVDI